MRDQGWLRIEAAGDAQGRYQTAYEPRPDLERKSQELLARSPKGRAAYAWLCEVGRPATGEEICAAAGCTQAVVRRLDQLGLVRKFSEIRGRSVERHLLTSRAPAPFTLRPDQEQAASTLCAAIEKGDFAPWLLRGMTGSGKTEVYLQAIAATLQRGAGAIVMVPEIAMVPALARTLVERFADQVAVLHSNLSKVERSEQWQRVRSGAAKVVVGPRSAVFAPLEHVGLIVVDEEHDSAYKQETTPRYHGRDLALVRARSESATAILASATPSLESRLNVLRHRYGHLELTERVGEGGLPDGVLVDLRRESFTHRPGEVHFSATLNAEIESALEADQQVILLRNRRGFAPLLLCRACGEDLRCDDCGLPRTWHRREARMLCHYCGSSLPVPQTCGSCGEAALEAIGAGTERVEEDFRALFPGVPVATLDRDSTQRSGGAAAVLERFRSGGTRVLVGTQMVAKGHHFPNVNLVAVLSADTYLGFPDFRAVERTYNLLTQVAGRAGRGDQRGRFVIQTHHPEHYAIQAALHHDDQAFAREELRFREIFHYPPFTRMILLLVQDRSRAKAEAKIRDISQRIDAHPLARDLRVVGPAPAAFEKLRGKWRFQLLLRGHSGRALRQLVLELGVLDSREVTVDVDPHDLL
jgi:primosomal protein N' (replication factor Y)